MRFASSTGKLIEGPTQPMAAQCTRPRSGYRALDTAFSNVEDVDSRSEMSHWWYVRTVPVSVAILWRSSQTMEEGDVSVGVDAALRWELICASDLLPSTREP
jgi:hypothetical protein